VKRRPIVTSRSASGYALVAGSFAIMGLIGTLVEWATAPESALLVMRFVVAGAALSAVFARRQPLAGARDRAVWPRLLLMGAIDAVSLLLFFVAIRENGQPLRHVVVQRAHMPMQHAPGRRRHAPPHHDVTGQLAGHVVVRLNRH